MAQDRPICGLLGVLLTKAMSSDAAMEAAQVLSQGRQRVATPNVCRYISRADVQEFFQLCGAADLEQLGSAEARPLSRLSDPDFVESGLPGPWNVGEAVLEDESITGPPAPINPSRLNGITSPSVVRPEKSLWTNNLCRELIDNEISLWRAAPGWDWNSACLHISSEGHHWSTSLLRPGGEGAGHRKLSQVRAAVKCPCVGPGLTVPPPPPSPDMERTDVVLTIAPPPPSPDMAGTSAHLELLSEPES